MIDETDPIQTQLFPYTATQYELRLLLRHWYGVLLECQYIGEFLCGKDDMYSVAEFAWERVESITAMLGKPVVEQEHQQFRAEMSTCPAFKSLYDRTELNEASRCADNCVCQRIKVLRIEPRSFDEYPTERL
jgi:hypothetical protein